MGKACDRAMWQHALRDEASQGWRLGAATVVCDGSKFYEHVEHGLLLANARATGYPLRVLRLNLAMRGAERRCSLSGHFSGAVRADRSIGAGCSHAQCLARLATIISYNKVVASISPGDELKVVVDDAPGQILGPVARIAGRVVRFMQDLRQHIERRRAGP